MKRVAFFFALASTGGLVNPTAGVSRAVPVIEMGAALYSGDEVNGLSGSQGYLLQFKSEESQGYFRPFVGVQFDYSMGDAYIDSTVITYTMYGGGFLAGLNFFLFDDSEFQPFIGANGVFGWNMLSVPSGGVIAPYTQGYSYGYEVSGGVDIRGNRNSDGAFRLRAGLWTLFSGIAGSTSFPINGFRFTAGFLF